MSESVDIPVSEPVPGLGPVPAPDSLSPETYLGEDFDQVMAEQEGRWVTVGERERGFVPSWYRARPHLNPRETIVTQGGAPLLSELGKRPFRVGEVPVELRWAIQENGEVLDSTTFINLHQKVYEEEYKALSKRSGGVKIEPMYQHAPKPNVVQYVMQQPDPNLPHRFVPMHYDAHGTSGAQREHYHGGDGEALAEAPIQTLLREYANPEVRAKMKPSELQAIEAHLGLRVPAASGTDPIVAKLEQLNEMLAAGDITADVHSRKVAELTGAEIPTPEPPAAEPTPAPAPAPAPADPSMAFSGKAACGREFTKLDKAALGRALHSHQIHCKADACVEARTARQGDAGGDD